jgi:hypothetical protein
LEWLCNISHRHCISSACSVLGQEVRNLRAGNAVDSARATRFALTQPDILGLLGHPLVDGETGVRILRELSRSYLTIAKDLSRVMSRLKAVYRSRAIPCAGRDVYYTRHRAQWLAKIREPRSRLPKEHHRRFVSCGTNYKQAHHPCRDRALMDEIRAIGVTLERRADSPNC